jgi:hypothetical protein
MEKLPLFPGNLAVLFWCLFRYSQHVMASVASVSGFFVHHPPNVCWALVYRDAARWKRKRMSDPNARLTVSSELWQMYLYSVQFRMRLHWLYLYEFEENTKLVIMMLFMVSFTDAWEVRTWNRRMRRPMNRLICRLYVLKVVSVTTELFMILRFVVSVIIIY